MKQLSATSPLKRIPSPKRSCRGSEYVPSLLLRETILQGVRIECVFSFAGAV